MGDFLVHQGLRHHPDHMPASGKGGIGYRSHQPDGGAAIDQLDPAGGHGLAERPRRREIDRILAAAGAAEDTQAHGIVLHDSRRALMNDRIEPSSRPERGAGHRPSGLLKPPKTATLSSNNAIL